MQTPSSDKFEIFVDDLMIWMQLLQLRKESPKLERDSSPRPVNYQ